ncbi:delta(1)-pyrroline-2-carboxylate reductase family protein [Acetobacter conturbans]|uniref:Delta(1)-pyrroline-2-carboxylate reductase family protein n=1 Tax=Acetobacter conturbans TaxID=1737472 RepID=A0ABX0K300_9PROT|nr:delta(1)-pyrroline-2-carboxylate reductase family protein [Acetobacter conturbans]NHN89577.1 delta(1)-pyrroline-2-carboxylate reductase family protein [Acetobacter conturbans]
MRSYDPAETARMLPFPELVASLRTALLDYAAGKIICPERTIVTSPDQNSLLMTMPAASSDVMVTKMLTICPDNGRNSLPVIQGCVMCADAITGRLLFSLDGPTVTKRRTAAISMLGLTLLHRRSPQKVLMFGTGIQAVAHCEALSALYPGTTVMVVGRTEEKSREFCKKHNEFSLDLRPQTEETHACDVILGVTSSTEILYNTLPPSDCTVIAVGAFRPDMIEFGPTLVDGSELYVDDVVGAPAEAGDFIQAHVNWEHVQPLAAAVCTAPSREKPVFFKSVGCAAWDLAACRTARDVHHD